MKAKGDLIKLSQDMLIKIRNKRDQTEVEGKKVQGSQDMAKKLQKK